MRDKVKKVLKTVSKEQWLVMANIIILFIMGILHSLETGHYVNFIPINGNFQDYNPIRRLLNGQIPYKDFSDYLGLGHLYLGTIFTGMLGGGYRASLIAFRLVAFLSISLIFYVIMRIILNKSSITLSVTNLLLAILLIQPLFIETLVGDEKVLSALNYAMKTGNSARMLRGAILPISAFAIFKYGKKMADHVVGRDYKIKNDFGLSILAGVLAGICFPWSNDYGISSWLCLLLMVFFVSLSKTRKILRALTCFILAIISSAISCFVVVEIATVGHFSNWLSATLGTGGYQAWYYLSGKSYYITDVDFSYIMLIQAFLGIFYLIKVWKNHADCTSIIRYGLLAYVNLASFCAVNEYKLLSGNDSREVALIVLFATIIGEIVNYIGSTSLREKALLVLGTASCVVCLAWIMSTCQTEFNFQVLTEKEGTYVDAMGGYMTSLGEDILKTSEFLGDKKTFATYASAQEMVSGNFQPSGTDYIIHVLGDQKREKYLDSFENDDFDYAVTINESYSGWEFWLQRANWFFYRSLFANWHPVYSNSYEVYWERNGADEDSIYTGNINVRVESETDSKRIKIIVEADESISGTADVYIDYESKKDRRKKALLIFNNMVSEENSGESFCNEGNYDRTYIRNSSKEYIPVTVINGYGEVTLTAEPEKFMTLTVNEAICSQIYMVQFQYLYIDKITKNENCVVLHTVDSNRTTKILKDISYIYLDDQKVEISNIIGQNIFIKNVNGGVIDNLDLNNGNMFKVE